MSASVMFKMELHISISCDLHKSLVSPSEPARSGAAACLALGRCLLARPPHSPVQSVARAAAAASSPHTVAAGFLLRRPTEKGEGGTQGVNAPRFMCALLVCLIPSLILRFFMCALQFLYRLAWPQLDLSIPFRPDRGGDGRRGQSRPQQQRVNMLASKICL